MLSTKKSAMEMSIGTIVIVVIAVTMLILGLVLVRTIMCSAVQLTEDVNQNVKNEIKNLFGTTKYGVICMGEGGQEIKIATGGKRKIVCMVKVEEQATYDISVDNIESLSGAASSIVDGWVLDRDVDSLSVSPGSVTEAVAIYMSIPRDAPTTSIKITLRDTNQDTGITNSHFSYIDIQSVGALTTAMC